MKIIELELHNFRNYADLNLRFTEGLNVLVGKNGAGKTNVVESIYFLSLARSFRTNEDKELIKEGENFATVSASFLIGTVEKKIRIILTEAGKKIICNGYEIKKISELADFLNVIVFQPKDVLLFEDPPRVRRRFLDLNILKISGSYLEALSRFDKLLEERNNILKSNDCNLEQLHIITKMMIDVSYVIVSERNRFVQEINPILEKILKVIQKDTVKVKLHYTPYADISDFQEEAEKAFQKSLELDLKRKVTSVGVHREDFTMTLNDKEITIFGSQGEKRLVALALKISPYFLTDSKDKKPIVILDDVLSELDKRHRERLLEFIKKFEQVFITATEFDDDDVSVYEIAENKVIRRTTHGK